MKKVVIFLATLMSFLLLVSCSMSPSFKGVIIVADDFGITVTPNENEEELKTADKIFFANKFVKEGLNLEVGDEIVVTYDGNIREVYPATLEKVTDVKIVKKAVTLDGD